MSRIVAVAACGFTLAACSASLPSLSFLKSAPPTEALRIESEPPGADAKTSLGQSCRTPCELTIQAGGELSVTLALNGYQPQTVSVRQESPEDPDASPPRLTPNPVYVELVPTPAPPAAKKRAPRKKPATAANPAPAPAATATAPALSSSPASEPAASATNYPWPSR